MSIAALLKYIHGTQNNPIFLHKMAFLPFGCPYLYVFRLIELLTFQKIAKLVLCI